MRSNSLNRLLRFAAHLTPDTAGDSAVEAARQRDWLDQHGRLTAEGLQLVSALDEQEGTRSVFR